MMAVIVECDKCQATFDGQTKYYGQARINARYAGWTFVAADKQPRFPEARLGKDLCPACTAGVPLGGETDL